MQLPWLSSQLFENVLRLSENDDSIHVINYSIEPATNKGDNFVSNMHRATVEFRRGQKMKEITEKKSLIVKSAPLTEGPQKEIAIDSGLFDIEINMMTRTLPEMHLLLKNTKLGAECYYKQDENPTFLIIEDLSPLGYKLADRVTGLDLDHCMLVMRNIAKFHASSVAVCEKESEHKDIYQKGLFNAEHRPIVSSFSINSMRTLTNCVKKWPELGAEYYCKLEKMIDIAYEIATKPRVRDDSVFNVINHGDVWVNNMLFKYNDEGKVIDHIFLDFQLSVYGSPAIDISHFLNTSVSDHVFRNHKNDLLTEYLNVLTTTMKDIGCKTPPPTMDDLQKALHKLEPCTFVIACTILPLVMSKSDAAIDPEELWNQDVNKYNIKAFENEDYKKIIIRRLIEWNNSGFLDKLLQQ